MIAVLMLAAILRGEATPIDTIPVRRWRARGRSVRFTQRPGEAIFEQNSLGFSRVLLSSGDVLLEHFTKPCCDAVAETDGGGPSPDGSLYVTLTQRGTEVVDLVSGGVLVLGHTHSQALFTPDGRGLLTVEGPFLRCEVIAGDQLLNTWRVELVKDGPLQKLAVSGPARLAAAATFRRVQVVRLGHPAEALPTLWRSLPLPSGPLESVTFSPDGNFLAVGLGQQVAAWDLRSGRLMWCRGPGRCCEGMSLNYSPDGRWIATTGTGISIREASTGRLIQTWIAHGLAGVFSAAFSPDGRTLVSVGFDGNAAVWKVRPQITR